MEMTFHKQSIRLSLFFFLLLFLSGRIGLFLHEFGGHALAWNLLGGNVTEFYLFIFGGGRVHYGATPAIASLPIVSQLIVQLSGITVELTVGVLLSFFALLSNAGRIVKGMLAAVSSVLVVHSLFYLVVCTYYGSGDGGILFAFLKGDVRRAFLVFSFSLTAAGAFFVSHAFSPVITSWTVADSLKKRILMIVLSSFAAAFLHGTLTIGEQIVVKDEIYTEIKTSKNVRLKRAELSGFIREYKEKYGREPAPEQISAVTKELELKYRQFPIEIPLGLAVLSAFIAGFLLSKGKDDNEPDPVLWNDILLLGSLSVMVTVLIVVLNRI